MLGGHGKCAVRSRSLGPLVPEAVRGGSRAGRTEEQTAGRKSGPCWSATAAVNRTGTTVPGGSQRQGRDPARGLGQRPPRSAHGGTERPRRRCADWLQNQLRALTLGVRPGTTRTRGAGARRLAAPSKNGSGPRCGAWSGGRCWMWACQLAAPPAVHGLPAEFRGPRRVCPDGRQSRVQAGGHAGLRTDVESMETGVTRSVFHAEYSRHDSARLTWAETSATHAEAGSLSEFAAPATGRHQPTWADREDHSQPRTPHRPQRPCLCSSGKKYKDCCLRKTR